MTIGGQAELFDPTAETFSLAAKMALGGGHTATLLNDGTVLVAGGQDTGGNAPGATAEVYSPAMLIPSPALFAVSGDAEGQGAVWHADTGQIASGVDPASAGDVLSMYTANLIDGSVIPPQISIGGRLAEILFFGPAPGYPGYYQVNFRVPTGVTPGVAVPVRLTYLGRTSNGVTIAVR